jgi:hypothetical protein
MRPGRWRRAPRRASLLPLAAPSARATHPASAPRGTPPARTAATSRRGRSAGAAAAALPWGLGALAVFGAACYQLTTGRRTDDKPGPLAVAALAIASAAAFVAAAWLGGTVLAARRLRPREPRTG